MKMEPRIEKSIYQQAADDYKEFLVKNADADGKMNDFRAVMDWWIGYCETKSEKLMELFVEAHMNPHKMYLLCRADN